MKIEELDGWADEGDAAAHRERVRAKLDQITQQARRNLDAANIGIEVFLVVPTTGYAVAMFGTLADPTDELWARATEIICSIIQKAVGLERAKCTDMACATTVEGRPTGSADLTSVPQTVSERGTDIGGSGDSLRHGDTRHRAMTDVRLPRGYSVMAQISLDPADWPRFEQMVGCTSVTKIIGHDPCDDERLLVRVACASKSVRDRLRDGWE